MHRLLQRVTPLASLGLTWLRAWPWFAASIALGFLIRENFPFSHWPMYANFAPESGYVYIVKGNGEPLAIAKFFETAPRLRRQFEREWKAEWKRERRKKEGRSRDEIEQEAATRMLKRLARRLSPEERAEVGRLGLVSARLKMDGDRAITLSERTVAMIGFNGIPFSPPPKDGAAPKESL